MMASRPGARGRGSIPRTVKDLFFLQKKVISVGIGKERRYGNTPLLLQKIYGFDGRRADI